uniref:Uncharacterized protein n=1 Tax=Schizaphis graminum TaxID=13262 RepID=A0A2S2PJR6_SCHGA
MDLETNYNVDQQNVMLISSEDPLVYETFNSFYESGDAMEHQLNAIDDSFVTFDDKMLVVQKPFNKDSVIKNKQSSSETPSSSVHENVLSTAEEVISNLSGDNLPLFHELLFNNDPIDENSPKIPIADELQEFKTQDHNITMADPLQEELVPITDQLQEEEHISMDDELQLASPSSLPPSAKGSRKRRRLQNIPHEYCTRKMTYKKSLANFMNREQEMLERERNNQQKPTALDAPTDHGRWSHTKNWVHVNLLKLDIPIKKFPNYSQTRRYKTRKTHSKNVPDTFKISNASSIQKPHKQ